MVEKANKTKQIILQKQKKEEFIEIDNKVIQKKFMVAMPNNPVDFEILADVFNPNFISKEMKEEGEKEYIGAISYMINEHDYIRSKFTKNKSQINLLDNKSVSSMLDYFDKTKLKIVDSNSEFLRIGNRRDISFSKLSKLPPLLEHYLKERKNNTGENKKKVEKIDDMLYYAFWDNIFFYDEKRRKRNVTSLISWNYEKEVKERNANIFLPLVPYIKRGFAIKEKRKFIKYTSEINNLSFQIYGERSAFYCVIDSDLFRDTDSINQLCDIISKCPNKFIILKILNINKFSQPNFGFYAIKNLLYFLKILEDTKITNSDRILGILNGGGFGYCLFNVVFDFFTDTVNNYPTESRGINTGKHRGLLHPITFAVEPSEGVEDQLKKHKCLFLNNIIADKYIGKENLDDVDKLVWSKDCRKMGMITWQKRMYAKLNTKSNHVFDEVYNSGFPYLGKITKNILNNF